MVIFIPIANFRRYVPVNAVVDDEMIASAIQDAQINLVPEVTSWDFYNELVTAIENDSLTDVQRGFLKVLQPSLAHFAATKLADICGAQMFPTKVVNGTTMGSVSKFRNYHRGQTSVNLFPVYEYCEDNDIDYNQWKSTEFCGIVLGGYYCK